MIDWLRRDIQAPSIELAGRQVPIEVLRHRTAKRLTLRLAPDGAAVRITVPPWCRSHDAIAFAHARRQWLEVQLAKVPPRADPSTSGVIAYRGRTLALAWDPAAKRRPALADDALVVGGPHEGLDLRLRRWLDAQALHLFAADTDDYCGRAGLPVAAVRLTRARRRWGSCSTSGTLRINWRLVQAPDLVRRSVVAHEVAHLVHFDHSPAFHALLDNLYEGDIAVANTWLREQGRTLYAAFG